MITWFKGKEYDLENECIVDCTEWKYAIHRYYMKNKDTFSWYAKYNLDIDQYYTVEVNSDKIGKVRDTKALKRNLDRGKFINISKSELDKMIKKVKKTK